MRQRNYLFDLTPYTDRRVRRSLQRTPVGVKAALRQLKRTMDAIPQAERPRRARRWRELNRSSRQF
jgi:hypothetical protein